MIDEKRPYRKQRRAESEQATRARITESAVELHGTLGPSQTSLSAIAAHAGVRRSTLYRHFPDEAAVFAACSAHWAANNPPPDLAAWSVIDSPQERLRVGLTELYAYYRSVAPMMSNVLRDEGTKPIVKETAGGFRSYIATARDVLTSATRARGSARRLMLAATGHALAFSTWQSLVREQELDDSLAAELMCRLVNVAAGGCADR
jgi:AcrR family transcriptional regulator